MGTSYSSSIYRPNRMFDWGNPQTMSVGDITAPVQDGLPMVDFMGREPGASNITPGSMSSNSSWWNSLFDQTGANGVKTQGMAMPLIAGASALMNGFMGYKQYGLQKDALAQTKKEFDMNWGAQQKTTNSALEDRQRARVASNPGAYQSVGDYMKKNGI